jgi:EAL domain-containing protein (putative c-di-GMP-specific phosphodiesterase class I)/GGDEF domain-containing protein
VRTFAFYQMSARLGGLSYCHKILLMAGLACLLPWLLALAPILDLPADPRGIAFLGVAAAGSMLAIWGISRLLSPIGAAAEAVSDTSGGIADQLPRHCGDELGIVLAGIADMSRKVDGLNHRWLQRHSITGLPTREFMLAEMAADIEAETQPIMLGALRFADYDRLAVFDPVSADLALKAFAEFLSAATGQSRPLAQVDRDCFAIWFRGSAREKAAAELKAICYALGGEIEAGELRIVPDIEAGAGSYPDDGNDAATILTRTLLALSKVSGSAGGELNFLVRKPAHAARERFGLEQDLRHAISRNQLDLDFQPVVDLAKGELVGAEALLRWRHPEAGLISPTRFIPILEDANLIEEIGMWTLNAACREARAWQRRGIHGLKMAVNLSATQLKDDNLAEMIGRTLKRHMLQPGALELELTETATAEDADRTFALFSALRAMGISLAIDDFGSGYSSLSYVKNLPFDKLKIDREFVVKIHERRDSQAICRSLVELTRGLGIQLLAEGVESEEEVATLRGFGCTLFQGYYFSKPLSSTEFVARATDPAWRQAIGRPLHHIQNEIKDRISA